MVDREFLRGFTKLYTLWRGSNKDVYGMAILKEMREVGSESSPGTLYSTLVKAEREGDIVWRLVPQKSFRHLAAAGIPIADKQDSRLHLGLGWNQTG